MSGGLGNAAAPRRETHRHVGDLHPEARRPCRWTSSRHAVALQRAGGVRRAQPHRGDCLGPALRPLPARAAVRPAGHEGHRLLRAARQRARLVTLYRRTPEGTLERTPDQSGLSSTSYFAGSGGMVSTAEDYAQVRADDAQRRRAERPPVSGPAHGADDDHQPHRRHGERAVRPPGPRHGLRPGRAGQRGSGRVGLAAVQGRVGVGGRLWHQLQRRAGRADGHGGLHPDSRTARCSATSRPRCGRRSWIEKGLQATGYRLRDAAMAGGRA